LRKSCGIDGIPNKCLRRLPRRPLVHLTHLFNHCLRLSHFPKSWKEAKIITLPKPDKGPKFLQNLRPISLLSTTGKLFEKVILKNMAFKVPYIYDYITKLCRQQAEVIQNHENANVRNIGQGEPRHRKYKTLKFGGGKAYDRFGSCSRELSST
jgi:hypothetical protein